MILRWWAIVGILVWKTVANSFQPNGRGTGMRIAIDRDRFVKTMEEQAEIGSVDGDGLDRLTLTDADRKVRDWFGDQMEAISLDVRVDEMGTCSGVALVRTRTRGRCC
jgi:hypothetical protein